VAAVLHYHPNVVAQGLVGRRSYLIGLFYENPSPNYVVELQRGALDRLHGERYRLIVLPVESAGAVAEKIVSFVRSAALDGIVLTPPASDNPTILERLDDAGFPFVRIAPTTQPEIGPSDITDDVAAARAMTDYLIGLGHRRIATIKGDPTHPSSKGLARRWRRPGWRWSPSWWRRGSSRSNPGWRRRSSCSIAPIGRPRSSRRMTIWRPVR
jgi:LacI family transcriptional regulator